MNNIDRIKSFDETEWVPETSSGYTGYRNTKTGEWIYSKQFYKRDMLVYLFEEKLKFLHDFRCDALPFGEYPDYVLLEFLNKYFDKQVKECYN